MGWEFLYNLSVAVKAFSILLLVDLCIGFHFDSVYLFIMISYLGWFMPIRHFPANLLLSTSSTVIDLVFIFMVYPLDAFYLTVEGKDSPFIPGIVDPTLYTRMYK